MLNNYIDTTSTKNCSTSYLIRSASTVDLNMEGNFLRSMGYLEFWNAPQNKSVLTQSDKRMFPLQFAKWLSVKKIDLWKIDCLPWCCLSDQADVQRLCKIMTFHNKTLFRHRIANLEYVSGLALVDFTGNSLVFFFSSRKSCWCLLGKTAKKISSVKDKIAVLGAQKEKKLKRVKFNLRNRRSVGGGDWVNVVFGTPVG